MSYCKKLSNCGFDGKIMVERWAAATPPVSLATIDSRFG
jgi:hypothetical protein